MKWLLLALLISGCGLDDTYKIKSSQECLKIKHDTEVYIEKFSPSNCDEKSVEELRHAYKVIQVASECIYTCKYFNDECYQTLYKAKLVAGMIKKED